MSQSARQREILQALAGDVPLAPEGSAKVQAKQNTDYIAIPGDLSDHHGLEQGDELDRYYHPETRSLVIQLPDSD
ncbi:hypothetical protein ACKVMT_09955 [Halobacteriales archaeon Cl-PHB]